MSILCIPLQPPGSSDHEQVYLASSWPPAVGAVHGCLGGVLMGLDCRLMVVVLRNRNHLVTGILLEVSADRAKQSGEVSEASASRILPCRWQPVYRSRTPHRSRIEARLSPELEDHLLDLLGNGVVAGFAIPLATLAVAVAAEFLATKPPRTYGDLAVTFDLLLTAVGTQLAALGAAHGLNRAEIKVRNDIDIGFAMLPVLLWLIVGAIAWIRRFGRSPSGDLKLRDGLILPGSVGLTAFAIVYCLAARLLGAP